MNYNEVLENARGNIGPYCKACPVCNGVACSDKMPGPGAKGSGRGAVNNFNAWDRIRVNLDTLVDNGPVSTEYEMFGHKFACPVFAGPVGAVNLHYGEQYNDEQYNDILVNACAANGIAAFTGDGVDYNVMVQATKAIASAGGIGIPTVKPWNLDIIKDKMKLVKESGCFAVAMDVDAAGLAFIKNLDPPAGTKGVEELRAVINLTDKPFIVKGVMTVKGALKAAEAGAKAILVSNHGGRVLDGCMATADVLPGIADAVKGSGMKVMVDGGIRSGVDVFKALAAGADSVVIARPFVVSVYGGAGEGVKAYINKISEELSDTMKMCGAHNLSEITRDMITI